MSCCDDAYLSYEIVIEPRADEFDALEQAFFAEGERLADELAETFDDLDDEASAA